MESQPRINQLTERRITIELLDSLRDQLCSICQTNFMVRDFVIGLECDHGFHSHCLRQWANNVC